MNPALQEAFNINQEALLAFIKKRLHDPQLAEDTLHDLYLKLQKQSLNSPVQFPKAYLFRMANNLVIDIQRRHARQEQNSDDEVLEQPNEVGPEELVTQAQQLSIIKQAMAELPDKTRDVFRMQRLQQIEKAQVADKLGISVNMVEKHLRRAIQFCRLKLKKSEN